MLAWALVVVGLMWVLFEHANRPAPHATPAPAWPAESRMDLAADRPTLLMVVHPRCPCTLASLDELDRLMTLLRHRIHVYAVFVQPKGVEDVSFSRSSAWDRAAGIEGVELVLDRGGAEAERFGRTTSGDVLLFDPDGRLRFHGGITPARGHRGDSLGHEALLQIVMEDRSPVERAPVYGCSLWDPLSSPSMLEAWGVAWLR